MRDPLDRGRSGPGSCRLNKQEAIGPWKHPFCASVWSMASLMNDLPPSSARAALVVIVIYRICKAPSVDGHPDTLHWSVHGFWASSERRTLLENDCRSGHWRVLSVNFYFVLFLTPKNDISIKICNHSLRSQNHSRGLRTSTYAVRVLKRNTGPGFRLKTSLAVPWKRILFPHFCRNCT